MFCTQCGQGIATDACYCSQCGRETGLGQARQASGAYAPKRLFRLRYDRKIAGICAGLARYLNMDVTAVRILTVAVACVSGVLPGVLAYVISWIIMPVDEGVNRPAPMAERVAT